ncbi:MAG: hypothetical protein R3C56_07675 [Pirellulaceae bacterium]
MDGQAAVRGQSAGDRKPPGVFFYERITNFGSRGCELRDLRNRLGRQDILGTGLRSARLATARGQDPGQNSVYNSSVGPSYAGGEAQSRTVLSGKSAMVAWEREGPLNDYWSVVNRPIEYVQELIDEGYRAVEDVDTTLRA